MKNKELKISKLAWIKAISYTLIYLAIMAIVVGIKHEESRIISGTLVIISLIFLIYSAILDKNNLSKKISERKLLYKEIKIAHYILLNKILYVGMAFVIIFTIYGFLFLTDQPLTSKDLPILEFVLGIEILAIIFNYFFIEKSFIRKMKEEYLKELKSSKNRRY
ncbi:hypothetical protein J4466_02150 [Candidatus Pacearchaeota archaeon]|nr:hypothetical protein [Candidatus Pacearchaeota archaeon]